MIDTHCHLNFSAFANDLDSVVRRAKENKVDKIIVPGADLDSSEKALIVAQQFPKTCFAAIGIHPHHAHDDSLEVNNNLKLKLTNLIKKGGDNVVAIGEIGLDFHAYKKTKYENNIISENIIQKQIDLFVMQMEIASEFNLPIIFHCRDAFDRMIQTMSAFISRIQSSTSTVKTNYIKHNQALSRVPTGIPGVFHCFSGSTQDLQLLITMGYFIGFDGNITYSDNYSTLVKSTSLNRILLETDAPYLTPVPFRGQRNEPKNIPLIAEQIAKYHNSPLSEVIHLSTSNAQHLFNI